MYVRSTFRVRIKIPIMLIPWKLLAAPIAHLLSLLKSLVREVNLNSNGMCLVLNAYSHYL
jgi:hypothetical protein